MALLEKFNVYTGRILGKEMSCMLRPINDNFRLKLLEFST